MKPKCIQLRPLFKILLMLCLCSLTLLIAVVALAQSHTAPVAKKIPHPVTVFANTPNEDTRQDDYFWLRSDDTNLKPEIIDYLNQENSYTEAMTAPLQSLREQIFTELKSRNAEFLDLEVPFTLRGYSYYIKKEPTENYPRYLRKNLKTNEEQLLIDGPALAAQSEYFDVQVGLVSPNGQFLPYGIDRFGKRSYALYVKDLLTGKVRTLREKDAAVVGYQSPQWRQMVWSADSRYLFYGAPGTLSRDSRVVRYDLQEANPTKAEQIVFDELDGDFYPVVLPTKSGKFIQLFSRGHGTAVTRVIPTDKPLSAPILLAPKEPGHFYKVDHVGDKFYILSNLNGTSRRVFVAPDSQPTQDHWKELFSTRILPDIEDMVAFNGYLVVTGMDHAFQRASIVNLKNHSIHEISFDEKIWVIDPRFNFDPRANFLRVNYRSYVTPVSVRRIDLESGKSTILKSRIVPGYDPSLYETIRVWATASDGTLIPINLTSKKAAPRDGRNSLWLTAYGSYGTSSINPFVLDQDKISLLNRGIMVGYAFPRGGGEMGYSWYLDGKLRKKKNTFTDFESAIEYLVKNKYTSQDRLAIEGVSAGGLLIGYILNNHPQLCRAAIANVPFVDLLNTMSDPKIPLTTQEYVEWGNPSDIEDYKYMRSYSPYDNVGQHDYPALLVTSSVADSQVAYWESAKWAARLRANKTDQNPLLLKMTMVGGHGGGSGEAKKFHEQAFRLAFVINQVAKH
jgi:oligopeptidase B